MKKIIVLLLTFLSIIVIYILNIDNEVYFFAIGETKLNNNQYSYNSYVNEYFKSQSKLEKYIYQYKNYDFRISDVINDINFNKKIDYNGKIYTMKNILIKSDLVTISLNNKTLSHQIANYSNITKLYTWIDELVIEYEKMLNLLRKYCKEKVIVIGCGYPNISVNNEEIIRFINYLNEEFLEVSQIYNVDYIDISKLEYEAIGKEIIKKYNG